MQESEAVHLLATKKTLRYLNGTRDYGIMLTSKLGTTYHAYVDADWGKDTDTRRSTSGILYMIDDSVFNWSSKIQPTISLSSTKSEYRVLTNASKDIIHFKRLLDELEQSISGTTLLLSDNQACIKLVKNPVLHARTKHIESQHHFICKAAKAGAV